MNVKLYHNPACGTSRNVLNMLREKGIEPQIVEYLKTPPTRAELQKLLDDMQMRPRDILRRKGTPYEELDLDNITLSDDQLLDALGKYPILMERPVVVSPKGTRVCRPAERLNDLL